MDGLPREAPSLPLCVRAAVAGDGRGVADAPSAEKGEGKKKVGRPAILSLPTCVIRWRLPVASHQSVTVSHQASVESAATHRPPFLPVAAAPGANGRLPRAEGPPPLLPSSGRSSIGHHSVINQSSLSHHSVINQSSVGHQSVINRSSLSHHSVITQSSVGHQSVINRSSLSHQSVIIRPSVGH